ncbi:MAG: response regulator, partial [bacterium]|nr:response regulator [bacterium]
MKNRILVIDDDQSTRLLLETFLSQKGYAVDCVEDAATMRESLGQREYPLILLDLNLPDADGLDLIEETKTTNPDIAIIIITAYGSIEKSVQAMRLGAYDFCTKPIELNRLDVSVD